MREIPLPVGAGDADQATTLAVKAKTDLLPADTATQIDTNIPKAAIIEDHFHNYENLYGLAAAPSGTHFGDRETITPYVPISGNNAFGTALGLLGTGDTPFRVGSTHYDVRKLSIIDVSNANPFIVRIIWGTPAQTAAQAVTAGQYTETVVQQLTANGNNKPQDIFNVRVPAGYQSWVQIKSATNNATVSLLISMHEYPSLSP